MPKHPGEPLRKVTLNLYEEDCVLLETNLGFGWSETVREAVHEMTAPWRKHKPKKTVGDLFHD